MYGPETVSNTVFYMLTNRMTWVFFNQLFGTAMPETGEWTNNYVPIEMVLLYRGVFMVHNRGALARVSPVSHIKQYVGKWIGDCQADAGSECIICFGKRSTYTCSECFSKHCYQCLGQIAYTCSVCNVSMDCAAHFCQFI